MFATRYFAIALVLSLMMLVASAEGQMQDATAVIRDHISWCVSPAPPERARGVEFKLVFNKSRTHDPARFRDYGYAGYMEGTLTAVRNGLSHNGRMVFSDRVQGGSSQKFDAAKSEEVSLVIVSSGKMYLSYPAWGNERLPLQHAVAYTDRFGAFITAMVMERNGTSVVSLTLHKIEGPEP